MFHVKQKTQYTQKLKMNPVQHVHFEFGIDLNYD
ncbi:hypothetical protein predicted by Glimmer/Critica [Lactiplantibacillus plantarum]|nr:hypothetical protein predicted by Glimmer/Critica [Lactiplantibacillus plantarum]